MYVVRSLLGPLVGVATCPIVPILATYNCETAYWVPVVPAAVLYAVTAESQVAVLVTKVIADPVANGKPVAFH